MTRCPNVVFPSEINGDEPLVSQVVESDERERGDAPGVKRVLIVDRWNGDGAGGDVLT
ncbi:hypothetical protein HQ459_00565, partial [bacterium]|nr:hypothetical protein [bacterium]